MYYYNSMTVSNAVECVKSIPETFKRRTTLTKRTFDWNSFKVDWFVVSSDAPKK